MLDDDRRLPNKLQPHNRSKSPIGVSCKVFVLSSLLLRQFIDRCVTANRAFSQKILNPLSRVSVTALRLL